MANGGRGTWVMFAVLAVGVVGLTGVFATYAAPLPLQRAMARAAALDAALATAAAPDPAAALAALAPRLGDSAAALQGPPAGLPARIAHERLAMRAHFGIVSEALAARLRMLVIVITAMGALFVGITVGGFSRRA
jgi:hypothetical protein